jgi:hypothetical protein
MKTSMIIIAALLLNTSLLIAEPLSAIVRNISPYLLMGVEAVLLFGYFINKWIQELRKAFELDLGPLNVFVVKSK